MVCNALHDILIYFRGDGLHLLVGLLQEIRELRQAIGQVRGQESLHGFLGHPVAPEHRAQAEHIGIVLTSFGWVAG